MFTSILVCNFSNTWKVMIMYGTNSLRNEQKSSFLYHYLVYKYYYFLQWKYRRRKKIIGSLSTLNGATQKLYFVKTKEMTMKKYSKLYHLYKKLWLQIQMHMMQIFSNDSISCLSLSLFINIHRPSLNYSLFD